MHDRKGKQTLFLLVCLVLTSAIILTSCVKSPSEIADAPVGLPVSADVNLLSYDEGRLEEFHNPKYLAATEGCLHVSTAISLPEGKTISLTLESDCPIDWYGDWDNPSPKIGIQFPQMRTYTEDSGWVTICSGAMETRQILASDDGKRLEVILTVHPDNSGASVSNIYKLFAVNFDLDSPHYLKYCISSYTAASLSPELEPMLGVEIREVKIHSYRSSYDAEGKVDPNFIEATFSWKTNKPCFYWFEIKPVDSENPYNSSSPQPYDTSRPLVQQVEHEITIILKPGGFHTYTLVIWDTEKNSARREGTFQAEGVSIPASSSQAVSSVDDIFLSRWEHPYYNNAPRVNYRSEDVTKLIKQVAPQIKAHYQEDVFDCSEVSAYLEYVLERHGYTASIAIGTMKNGGHAWLLVYDNVDKSWVPIEATLPITILNPELLQLMQRDTGLSYLEPDWKWESIYDVTIISEFDWWNTPFADELVQASDSLE